MKTSTHNVKLYSERELPAPTLVLGFVDGDYEFLYYGKYIGWNIWKGDTGFSKLTNKEFTWCYLPEMED